MRKLRLPIMLVIGTVLLLAIFMVINNSCRTNEATVSPEGTSTTSFTNESTTTLAAGVTTTNPSGITTTTTCMPTSSPSWGTTNYTFDAGVKTARDAFIAATSGGTTGSWVISGAVVTAKDIYIASGGQKSWCIQDQNAGLWVFDNTGISASVGDRINVTLTKGETYYGMPEATNYNNLSIAGSVTSLYYKTSTPSTQTDIGIVYKISGTVTQAPDSSSVGVINSTNYFHCDTATKSMLNAGANATIIGPVSYMYSKYRIECPLTSNVCNY